MKTFIVSFIICLIVQGLNAQKNCLPADVFINQTFKKYNIIGLDEGPHATIQIHNYLRKLIACKSVNQVVDYIILEFLNTSYQGIIDDYIAGKEVTIVELREAWRNGTVSHNTTIGEASVYFELLKTIRLSNSDRSNTHKIRVLGGDPGMDWSKITTQREFFRSLSQRDLFPAHLAIEYGINQRKKVLMIYGGLHYGKYVDKKLDSSHWTIDYIINNRFPNSIYTISMLRTTHKKMIDINSICSSFDFQQQGYIDSVQTGNGQSYPILQVYDALYYLGTSERWTTDDAKAIDKKYWFELDRRSKIVWGSGLDPKYKKND